MPDHGERHAKNEKVAEEGQETIGETNHCQRVFDTMALLVLIPEEGDRSALQGARQEGSHRPEGRVNPDTPRYLSEGLRHEKARVEEDDRGLDAEYGGSLESLDDPDRLDV